MKSNEQHTILPCFFSLHFVSNKVDLRAEDKTAGEIFWKKISRGGGEIFYFLKDSARLHYSETFLDIKRNLC
jgi:hypothetical protein